MNRWRPFLWPVASFALAWVVSRGIGSLRDGAPADVGERPAREVSRPRPLGKATGRVDVSGLVGEFQSRPVGEWAGMWEEFVGKARREDFEELLRVADDPPGISQRRDRRCVLHFLAQEELGARSMRQPPREPGAFAALTAIDPEAAWRALEANHQSDLAVAVLRTLAGRNPAEALAKCRAMAEPPRREWGYETPAGVGGMHSNGPLGAVFGAWVRQDPDAALVAYRTLSPVEQTQVFGDIAAGLAFRDGAAGLRLMLPKLPDADPYSGEGWARVLRGALHRDPAAAAAIFAAEPELRRQMEHGRNAAYALNPWFDADPSGVVAWMMEDLPRRADATLIWSRSEPAAALVHLRTLAEAGGEEWVECAMDSIAFRYPDVAEELAEELGMDPSKLRPFSRFLPDIDPAAACEWWLAQVERDGDPQTAMESLGWVEATLGRLATLARDWFPEHAGAMSGWLPEPQEASGGASVEVGTRSRPISRSWLALDPAAAVRAWEFNAEDPQAMARSVKEIVEHWAPYDPEAVRRWLATVTDPQARAGGESALTSTRVRPFSPNQAEHDARLLAKLRAIRR